MNSIEIVVSLMVLCGALFMSVAIILGERTRGHIPHEVQRRWRVMLVLMVFFLLGYLAFLTLLVTRLRFPVELVTGTVFLGGAVFVYIVINLTRETITRIKTAEENLKELNETLEDRIAERTAELQRSQQTMQAILSSMPYGVVIIDKNKKIKSANAAALTLMKYESEEQIVGMTCNCSLCPAQDGTCPILDRREKLDRSERILLTKDGKRIPILKTVVPVTIDGEEVLLEAFIDITERKIAEEALHESEKRYRALFESAGDAIFILEAEGGDVGKIVAVNKTAAEMHGYTIDELMHKNIRVFDTPESAHNDATLMRRILGGEWVKGFEKTHRRKNGTVFPVEINAGLLEFGNHRYILGFDRDITERKSAEKKLERYSAELKQSNEDVLSFAYIVSHDLRAPLVSIKGFTGELLLALKKIEAVIDACMSQLSDQERSRIEAVIRGDVPEAMKFIGSSVSRMDGLINNILMLSRAGHRELKPELIDMKELTNSILSSLAHQIERSKTSIIVGELPVITADKIAMEQILGNLIDNALKYLEQGREGKVTITAEQGAHETTFHIRDNGRGIAKDDLSRIFEIFRRVGKQDVAGEGMGLAFVKALVKRHDGRIWCESEPGVGTAFSFTIPIALTSKVPA